jgi:hypothetical protein
MEKRKLSIRWYMIAGIAISVLSILFFFYEQEKGSSYVENDLSAKATEKCTDSLIIKNFSGGTKRVNSYLNRSYPEVLMY